MTNTAADIVLEVHICKARRSIVVRFATDEVAAAYIERNGDRMAFEVIEGAAGPKTWLALDPPCEHGLSLRLCAGPGHYPMD